MAVAGAAGEDLAAEDARRTFFPNSSAWQDRLFSIPFFTVHLFERLFFFS